MRFKTNLHFHTADDPEDGFIKYSFFAGIDRAKELNFDVIALTCHNKFVDFEKYKTYAARKNILLIPGIEKSIERKHVLILNADADAEKIKSFADLRIYKKDRPEIFVIAPHPYFLTRYSLNSKLEKNIELFDAIESSWFYSEKINRNRAAEKIAEKYNLPVIATSDTHELKLLNRSYALIEAEEKTIRSIFDAIRRKKIENINPPKKFWREMMANTFLKLRF